MKPEKIRIGTVPYLNVEPLTWALESPESGVDLVAATPRDLADRLARGEVEVGLVPVAEVIRTGHWEVVPGVSIACDGPVQSCLMVSKVPWGEVKSILLDRSSMTSVLLGQLLLREGHGIAPQATLSEVPLKAAHDFDGDEHDAFVLIGDEALRLAPEALPHRIDLGEGWKQLTGLPFVFAVWALAEPGAGDTKENRSEAVARILTEAAVRGLRNLDAVSESGAKRHALPLARVRPYLAGSIRYGLGPHEQEAVAEFGRRLVRVGLLEEAHPLRIAETRTAEAGRGG